MALQLYNSLTRKKEEFKPIEKGRAGVYVCGPTVYGHAHLGHAKSYVGFDCLVRYLRHLGYSVTYVQNITDVGHLTDDADEGQDKIIVEAKKQKKHPMAVAEYYTRSYFEDMDALNCVRPDISPRATGHITEQIEAVKTLVEKGYAYEAGGSVYFAVEKFKDYGRLSGRNVEEMLAGARVKVAEEKRHPADFALWKKAEPNHVMQWPSPWGPGFPGWHLECSVMGMKYLGETIDIHGGGLENQFPHHDCEIAQAEAATGKPFVRYWLHNNMVTVDGRKMGKSLNNFITLKDVFAGSHERLTQSYCPLAVRQLVLNSHYRNCLDFSDAALFAARSGHDRITDAVKALRGRIGRAPEGGADPGTTAALKDLTEKFEAAMDDDLNTSVALSVIFEMVRLSAEQLERGAAAATLAMIDERLTALGGGCLGIVLHEYPRASSPAIDGLVEIALEQRNRARRARDFETADAIRDRLTACGIILEDRPEGTIWRTR
jgi:cysteinyl-tRNA synthetase